MDLHQLVKTVGLVRDTSRKTEKVRLLAELLQQTEGREAELAAHYLCGTTPQGKIGIGWAVLQKAADAS
jgi:DNA ligase-1